MFHPQDLRATSTAPHRVVVLALDGVYPFELGIPSRILGAADDRYDVVVTSADGRPVRTNGGFTVTPDRGPEVLESAGTVIVAPVDPGGLTQQAPPEALAALARIAPGTRIASICTGGFVLAAAGLLDHRPATTHWECAPLFRKWYPHIRLDESVLFVDDGDVLTSAGAASGIDLCLHLIRTDHGIRLANSAARRCVVPPFREGGQAQYIERPIPQADTTSTSATRQWALERLGEPLPLPQLARHAHMSMRTFSRRFRDETGVTPRQWLIRQRLDRALHLLETSELTVDQIAAEIGFATAASLRQLMNAELGVSPGAYRRTFQASQSSARIQEDVEAPSAVG
ncbi:helix-turn-helix domain-containing protein [Streptomyces sp. NPDC046716]|uniref:GlxA family transcriptional regulator n=1 Tax=Streptomyces sp. NPDC046716 TaxID=3157093 RepID=UPI0033C3803C